MLRRRSLALVALLVVAALWSSACAVSSPTALEVDGTTVGRSQFVGEMEAFAANPAAVQALYGGATQGDSPGTFSTSFSAYLLSLHVIDIAVGQALADRDLDVSDAERQAMLDQAAASFDFPTDLAALSSFERLVVDILAGQEVLVTAVGAEVTSDEALQARFEELRQTVGEVGCTSHILIRVGTGQGDPTLEDVNAAEAEVAAVRAELEGGADFATVAAARSDDTSATAGGALGCQPRGSFVTEFDDAAWNAPVGQVVEVATEFGYHFLVVTERRPLVRADVEEDLAAALQQEVQQAAQAELQAVLAAATVSVDGQFGRWDAEALQVAPPEGPLPAGGTDPLALPLDDGA
jgi:hypothetical protein